MPSEKQEQPSPATPPAEGGNKPSALGGESKPTTPIDWRSQVPDEFKDDPSIKDFKDIGSLVKSYIHGRRMLGMDKVIIPKEDSPPEVMAEFRAKMGVPEAPDKYELPKEGVPQDVQFDQDVIKEFLELAHKTNMSKAQVAEAIRWQANKIAQYRQAAAEKEKQAREAAMGEFRKKLGHAFDESIGLARKAVRQFGGEGLQDYMNQTGLGDDPRMVEAWIKVGKALAGDSIHGEGVSRTFIPSPEEAKDELKSLMADAGFKEAYNNPRHPQHTAMKKRWHALMDSAYAAAE